MRRGFWNGLLTGGIFGTVLGAFLGGRLGEGRLLGKRRKAILHRVERAAGRLGRRVSRRIRPG